MGRRRRRETTLTTGTPRCPSRAWTAFGWRSGSLWLRVGLVIGALCLAGLPGAVLGQTPTTPSEVRYIDELKQRNADYGPGCNGIGISTPRAVNMPADISTRWAAGHSACIPGMRLVMACIGEVVEADRLIGCTLQVADGQAPASIGCEQLTLLLPHDRVQPDPVLSDILSQGSEGGSVSCAEPRQLAAGTTIAAAYRVPAAETRGDLALMIDVDGSEVPAFLIPAAQVDVAPVEAT